MTVIASLMADADVCASLAPIREAQAQLATQRAELAELLLSIEVGKAALRVLERMEHERL